MPLSESGSGAKSPPDPSLLRSSSSSSASAPSSSSASASASASVSVSRSRSLVDDEQGLEEGDGDEEAEVAGKSRMSSPQHAVTRSHYSTDAMPSKSIPGSIDASLAQAVTGLIDAEPQQGDSFIAHTTTKDGGFGFSMGTELDTCWLLQPPLPGDKFPTAGTDARACSGTASVDPAYLSQGRRRQVHAFFASGGTWERARVSYLAAAASHEACCGEL